MINFYINSLSKIVQLIKIMPPQSMQLGFNIFRTTRR
jgi:hypothetical protein